MSLLDRGVVGPLPHVAERRGQAAGVGDGQYPAEAPLAAGLAEQADPAHLQDGHLGRAGVLGSLPTPRCTVVPGAPGSTGADLPLSRLDLWR